MLTNWFYRARNLYIETCDARIERLLGEAARDCRFAKPKQIARLAEREKRLQATLPRYWHVGLIGGGAFPLGRMTRDRAMQRVTDLRLIVRYVDDEQCFIAASDPKSEELEK